MRVGDELTLVGDGVGLLDGEPARRGVTVHVVRVDGVEALRLAHVHALGHDRRQLGALAHVEPALARPVIERLAERRRGQRLRVRPPLLVTAGVDVADHLDVAPVQSGDGLRARPLPVEVVDRCLDGGVERAAVLDLPALPTRGLPPRGARLAVRRCGARGRSGGTRGRREGLVVRGRARTRREREHERARCGERGLHRAFTSSG